MKKNSGSFEDYIIRMHIFVEVYQNDNVVTRPSAKIITRIKDAIEKLYTEYSNALGLK